MKFAFSLPADTRITQITYSFVASINPNTPEAQAGFGIFTGNVIPIPRGGFGGPPSVTAAVVDLFGPSPVSIPNADLFRRLVHSTDGRSDRAAISCGRCGSVT